MCGAFSSIKLYSSYSFNDFPFQCGAFSSEKHCWN